jgi:uncharacterized protein (TIGR00730 family)
MSFAEGLGDILTKEGDIELIWGGNAHGPLAKIRGKFVANGRKDTLVLPKAYEDDLKIMTVENVVLTDLIDERTRKMLSMSDAVIVIPGGIGTIYEFWTAVETKRAREHDAKIILFNYKGFYDGQLAWFDLVNENGFTSIGHGGSPYKTDAKLLFSVAKTPEEVVKYLKN